jgi:hypothetical protein
LLSDWNSSLSLSNTCPDIAYAISQVARFSHNLKKYHASAIKPIFRYLAGTKEKGVLYRSPESLTLDCSVDTDFAGLYRKEPAEYYIFVKYRNGYTILIGVCYILYKSQLQSTIALSTRGADYGALSQAIHTLIPVRETILDIIKIVDMVLDKNGKKSLGSKQRLKVD